MNMTELAVMVKALGETVDMLAKLVEGLPKTVERKLAAHAASVEKKLDEFRRENDAFQACSADADSKRTIRMDMLSNDVIKTMGELRQIIADNQETAKSMIDSVKEFAAKTVVDASRAASEALEGKAAELSKLVADCRSACDTTDVHHSIKKIEGTLESFAKAEDVAGFRAAFDALEKKIPNFIPDKIACVTQVDAVKQSCVALGEVIQGMAAASAESFARTESKLSEHQELLAAATKAASEEVSSLRQQVEGAMKAVESVGATVTSLVAKTTETTASVIDLSKSCADIRTDLEAVQQSTAANAEAVYEAAESVVEAQAHFKAMVADIRAEMVDTAKKLVSIDTLNSTSASLESKIKDLDTSVKDQFVAAGEGVAKLAVSVQASVAAVRNDLGERIASAESAAAKGDGATVERIAAVAKRVDEADEAIRALSGTFINLQNFAHDTSESVKSLSSSVVADLSAVNKRVDELPEPPAPFDDTAFEVRILNKMAELIPEHASVEVPAPVFDMAFEEGTLVVRAKWGEDEVMASTPVNIGFAYKGIYSQDVDYVTGNMVTHKGSMWYAKSKPTGEPGKDITGWQLAVKCGRDGRDATPTRAYDGHDQGRLYKETDFLRINNRLWQCAVKETTAVPGPGDITSTREWLLIGGVH
jgi:predicted HicB family RNase H-like nuclease